MQLRLLFSISLLGFMAHTLRAQTADDFFHGGARAYLTNNIGGATNLVDQGLKLYPDDIKLKKLDELLKQQQQQQQQNQKDQSQSKQDQQKKDQQQQQSDEQKQKEQQKEREKQKQQEQNQKPDQQKQGEKQQPKEQEGKPGQMTPEEAKRLLDSQKNDEALLPPSQKDKHKDREHPLKDW